MFNRRFSQAHSSAQYLFAATTTASVGGYFAYRHFEKATYTSTPALHYYAANGSEEDIESLRSTYGRHAFQYDATSVTCNGGNTALHLAAANNHPRVVELIVDSLGGKASAVTKLTNHKGDIAIEVIGANPHANKRSSGDHARLFRALKPATIKHSITPITASVDKKRTADNYPDLDRNSEEFRNLMYAVEAINETRAIIRESSTDPALNYSHSAWLKIAVKINNMRDDYDDEMNKALFTLSISQTLHKIVVNHAKKEKIGNCGEYSHVAADSLMKKGIRGAHRIF